MKKSTRKALLERVTRRLQKGVASLIAHIISFDFYLTRYVQDSTVLKRVTALGIVFDCYEYMYEISEEKPQEYASLIDNKYRGVVKGKSKGFIHFKEI